MRQWLASGLGQERRRDHPEDKEQPDDRRCLAIAAESDDQGPGDQRADAGDPARRVEAERNRGAAQMMLSVTFGFWGVATFVPTYVGTVAAKAGLSAPFYSAIAGLLGTGVSIFGFITLGFLADGIGRRPTAMLYYAMCLVLTPVVYMWATGMGQLLVAVTVFGFFTGGIWAWAPVWLPELFPTRKKRRDEPRADTLVEEHIGDRKAGKRCVDAFECDAGLLLGSGGASALIRLLPARRFGHAAPEPQHKKGRQDPDQVHKSPGVGPQPADQ
jgi:hypothetical protein